MGEVAARTLRSTSSWKKIKLEGRETRLIQRFDVVSTRLIL
jgi:hypothetical protein